jgi:hypothetical protein
MVRRPVDGRTFRLKATRLLDTDRPDAVSLYETLVTSDPGAAILDLYGATESAVDAIIDAYASDASLPVSWRDTAHVVTPELLDEFPRSTWIRAQRASLAAIQIITEDALQSGPSLMGIPDVGFPAGRREEAPVVLPFKRDRAYDVFTEAEFALPALPSAFAVGAEVEAGFEAKGWLVDDHALFPVANTPRLPLLDTSTHGADVPRRLVNLAERALASLYGGSRPYGEDLFTTYEGYEAEDQEKP